jgi:prepilin-type processing-associated H-X9-DG protein/prepilin-type N-terminal cleavage/methylation domain-containing protein
MARPLPQRRAVTLVEVLVVVVILGLLMALLFPAIMRIRGYAAQLEDGEQLRKLGKSWLLYAQVNQGKTLQHKTKDDHDRWIKKLGAYNDNIDECIISPGDPMRQARYRWMEDNPGRKTSSFVLNPYFSTEIKDSTGKVVLSCTKLSECKSLSTAIAILPVSEESGIPGIGYIFPQGWFAKPITSAWKRTTAQLGIQPDRFLVTNATDHLGVSNYLFADGHVEAINSERFKALVEQGKNFLVPEQY